MYTRFVITAMILLGILSSADARRHHHARHRIHSDRHLLLELPRPVSVHDTPSVFDVGSRRVEWYGVTQSYWEPPTKSHVAWVKETQYITVTPDTDYRWAGWLSLLGGALFLSYVGGRAYLEADRPMVLVRCQPASPRWWNVVRLWWKQALTFAIQSYRSHTIGTVRRRKSPASYFRWGPWSGQYIQLSPEEKWDLHHHSLF